MLLKFTEQGYGILHCRRGLVPSCSLDMPAPDCVTQASGHYPLAVRDEYHTMTQSRPLYDQLASTEIPDPQETIYIRGRDVSPIRTELNTQIQLELLWCTFDVQYLPRTVPYSPDTDAGVPRGRSNPLAIG